MSQNEPGRFVVEASTLICQIQESLHNIRSGYLPGFLMTAEALPVVLVIMRAELAALLVVYLADPRTSGVEHFNWNDSGWASISREALARVYNVLLKFYGHLTGGVLGYEQFELPRFQVVNWEGHSK